MDNERSAHCDYAGDVDAMILEYLIYCATEGCIDDFMTGRVSKMTTKPSQSVLTQLHMLDDFSRIYKAKYHPKELDEEVCLWLDLLELVVSVSYRHADSFPLSAPADLAVSQGERSGDLQAIERRKYWLSARDDSLQITDCEHSICSLWDRFRVKSPLETSEKLPNRLPRWGSISTLFFTISAKIASFIDQGISEQWVALAAQLMVQTALESLLAPEGVRDGENALVLAFAWGWIPPTYWDDYKPSDENSVEAERVINDLFEVSHGDGARENQLWREMRLNYMSLFGNPQSGQQLDDTAMVTQLKTIAKDYPVHELEKKVVLFLEAMWKFCRKPLLAQIEEGKVEGMTDREFEDFKNRIFIPS